MPHYRKDCGDAFPVRPIQCDYAMHELSDPYRHKLSPSPPPILLLVVLVAVLALAAEEVVEVSSSNKVPLK